MQQPVRPVLMIVITSNSDRDSPAPAMIMQYGLCGVTPDFHRDTLNPVITIEASDEGSSFNRNITTTNKTPSSIDYTSINSAERISKYLIQFYVRMYLRFQNKKYRS